MKGISAPLLAVALALMVLGCMHAGFSRFTAGHTEDTILSSEERTTSVSPRSVGRLSTALVYPRPLPVMPWDTVRIQVNITEATGLERILLMYSTSVSEPSNYTSVEMKLKWGNLTQGSFEASIPPKPSGTTVHYYVRLCWSNGEWQDEFDATSPMGSYNVMEPQPCEFDIVDIAVEKVDLENRNVKVVTNLFIYAPTKDESIVQDPFTVVSKEEQGLLPDMAEAQPSASRFRYYEVKSWAIQPFGDYRKYPFDEYDLKFNLTIHGRIAEIMKFPESTPLLRDYHDRYAWTVTYKYESYTRTEPYTCSTFAIYLHLKRNIESTYGILVPTLSLFWILGATLLISGKNKLRNRLTAFVSIFALAWAVYSSVGRYVPGPAQGISLLEALLTSSVLYAVIFLAYTTLFDAISLRYKSVKKLECWANLTPIFSVLYLMMNLEVQKWQWGTTTLMGLASGVDFPILATLVVSVSYGGILELFLGLATSVTRKQFNVYHLWV